MNILAFDCSGGSCSAAVLADGTIRAERFRAMARGQAEALMPQIRDVMDEARLAFRALDALATVIGPGSFTGLRLGLAAARGLALAANLPIIGLTAFEAYLADVVDAEGLPVAIAINSRRGPVFAQLFGRDRQPIGPPVELEIDQVAGWLPPDRVAVAGDGAESLRPLG